MLNVDDFDAFFRAVHGTTPFPWQKRLLRKVVEDGGWPRVLDLPTGSGKTAAIDIALFHLALEAERMVKRRAPVRIALVVDRRLVVDDAFSRAQRIEQKLTLGSEDILTRVASALRRLAGENASPVLARRLRGGIPREDDWARTPAQPTIICSTVDQVGSRLLFRGYGITNSMKPVQAGLFGADCLILLDEAHLANPFRQTLDWVRRYRGADWREVPEESPWAVSLLTATPGETPAEDRSEPTEVFTLDDEDFANPLLKRRLEASKPARLLLVSRSPSRRLESSSGDDDEIWSRADALVAEARNALKHFTSSETGNGQPAIGVVVNRVARARAVFDLLIREQPDADVQLIIGPSRPIDRDWIVERLAPVRTGVDRSLERPLILVATQSIEAGVDIDLDGLITELAPIDSLRQRFGRLNRNGRPIEPYAAIVAWRTDISRREDPVYGHALRSAWECLNPDNSKDVIIDFGLTEFEVPDDVTSLAPRENAPVLLPAHVELLRQTSPIPGSDPDIAFFLHGPSRDPDSISVIWRGDITGDEPDGSVRRLLSLAPPRATETIQLPLWAVRRWLKNARDPVLNQLADTASTAPDESEESLGQLIPAFRWRGDDDRSAWIQPWELRPGDTIVVPAKRGGVDSFGWNPAYRDPVPDVGAAAARPFALRRFVVRIAPGLVGEITSDRLAETIAGAESRRWADLRDALLTLPLPEELREDLRRLDQARRQRVIAYSDVYPLDDDGRIRGIVFVAPLGIDDREFVESGDVYVGSTEDDIEGSLTGIPIELEEHSEAVSELAVAFAKAVGLPEDRQVDLRVAGLLHDTGKADSRFQAWMHYGDALGPDPDEPSSVLAKSGRSIPRNARSAAGLPDSWRHEALSVRLAPFTSAFEEARDPELVLWLIGSHHGWGRPFFPHGDPADVLPRDMPAVMSLPRNLPAGAGPQSFAFDCHGADWPALFERVTARYGYWELARMEAILRLADHRVSQAERENSTFRAS